MADVLLLKALKTQPKVLNLNNKKLKKVPKLIGKLTTVLQVHLRNNSLRKLPFEFGDLVQVV